MADLKLIESNVVSTLQNVKGFNKVWDHERLDIGSLPAATLWFDGFGQDDEAGRRNSVSWRWTIRIYVSLHTDAEKSQNELKDLIIKSMDQLRQNPRLGGSCLFHTIGSGDVFVALDQNNPQLMGELNLVATTRESY
jgi:hypothetical protein